MSEERRNLFQALSSVIQRRKTTKVLADPADPVSLNREKLESVEAAVRESVRVAAMAPFHHDRKTDGLAEPWRVTILWNETCRCLATELPGLIVLPPNNRLPNLMSGCAAAVFVSWLPAEAMADSEKEQHVNVEHVAATGAYVQNLLLLLEAQGLESYWASAGLLASPAVLNRLNFPDNQKVLAVVYVGVPGSGKPGTQRLGGKNRVNRGDAGRLTREINKLD